MLNALLRTASVITLLCGTACQFSSAPNIGQSSGTNARKKVDAGSEDAEGRRVSTASGDVRSRDAAVDAEVDSRSTAAGSGGRGSAGDNASSATENSGGTGGAKPDEADPQLPEEEAEGEPPQQGPTPQAPTPGQAGNPAAPGDAGTSSPSATDAGAQLPAMDAAVDAGPRPTVDNPTGVLGDLANRTAGGKTAATITQFLETLSQGEAPSTSIREFLLAIDDEMDCVMNPFATECLAACQAVSTTCGVCVFDQMCRATMLEICGYSALAGCVSRG